MPGYVDGFVLPVPKKNLKAYRALAQKAGKIWKELGALEYRECGGEDMKVAFGKSFPSMIKPKRGETILFSWIVYRSRKHRDEVNKRVMKDPRMQSMCGAEMPFDVKRMVYGGFEILVEF